jgi:hypothetical protein
MQDHKEKYGTNLTREEILVAEVDLDLQENTSELAFFRDRRIDAFGDITKEQSTNYGYYK